jgi:hypothetical protein
MTSCSYPIITNIYIQLVAASFVKSEEKLSKTSEQNNNGNSGQKHLFPNLHHLSHIPHCSIHLFVNQPLNQSPPIVLDPPHARAMMASVGHRLSHSRAHFLREIVVDNVLLPFSCFNQLFLRLTFLFVLFLIDHLGLLGSFIFSFHSLFSCHR